MKTEEHKEIEREASYFAMCLLIPAKDIQEDMKIPADLCSDDFVKALCKKYQVSATMLLKRVFLLNNYKTK